MTFSARVPACPHIEFLKKLRADAGGPIIVIADGASYHGSGPVKRYQAESQGDVVVEYLPTYCPDLNPDEQLWNHAKARLAKRFVATKDEFKAALLAIMFSIQRSIELILSFFLNSLTLSTQPTHLTACTYETFNRILPQVA